MCPIWQTDITTLTEHTYEDAGPNTWLAWYNPPNTEQNDTDIVGQSIIQLSSEAF